MMEEEINQLVEELQEIGADDAADMLLALKARAEAAEKLAAMPYDSTGLNAALDEAIYQRERAEAAEKDAAALRAIMERIAKESMDYQYVARAALEAKP